MAARLKVFVTSDGFTDYVVATSSRPKALAAWGVRQDVFKEGRAQETDDPALVKAATARPGEVLRRPAGSRAKLAGVKRAVQAAPDRPSAAAQRRSITQLERRLAALVKRQEAEETRLRGQRDRLDAQLAALVATQARARQALEEKLRAARQAPG